MPSLASLASVVGEILAGVVNLRRLVYWSFWNDKYEAELTLLTQNQSSLTIMALG